jgi:hypothetical protein
MRLRDSLSPSLRDSAALWAGVKWRLGSLADCASSCCCSIDLLSHPRATIELYERRGSEQTGIELSSLISRRDDRDITKNKLGVPRCCITCKCKYNSAG